MLIASIGCGDGKIGRYPVSGTVLVDGKPADGATVYFCPTGGSEELLRERPFGTTGPDGKYLLTTLVKDDGAPAGQYKVLVQWIAMVPQKVVDRDRSGGRDRLRGRYMNLEKSTLTATVEEGPIELPPFELKTK
ncbi:MAG: hypothetical protein WD468_11505 [Pirellulales bacterium]